MMISYAVYIQKDGRWWVEKNFPANAKNAAVDLANDIARTTPWFSVRVVREVHEAHSNTFNEQIILKLDATKPPPISRAQLTGGGKAKGGGKAAAGVAIRNVSSDTEDAGSSRRSLGKVLVMAVPGGVLTGAAISAMILYTAIRLNIPAVTAIATSPYALFTYFFISAVSATVFLIYKIEPDLLLAEGDGYYDPEPEVKVDLRKYKKKNAKKEDDPPAPEEIKIDEEKPKEPAPAEEAEAGPPTADLSAIETNGGMELAGLLLQSITAALPPGLPATRMQIYAFHVFLAGLSEEFGFSRNWDDQLRRAHMYQLLEPITVSRERSADFVRRYEEYISSPHDEALRQAGAQTARNFLAGVPGADAGLANALADWTNATQSQQEQDLVVMFTDIVGSTDFAQTHGNERALLQVRAHDQIINAVLDHYGGQRVKHTGDGVMATFYSALDAVRAACVIQKAANAHTTVNPELPIRLRIGINNGKAIRERDDVFGQGVQLAARLCAAAQPEQIVVNANVVQSCDEQGVAFQSLGTRTLKGVPEPVEIFQVDWAPKA